MDDIDPERALDALIFNLDKTVSETNTEEENSSSDDDNIPLVNVQVTAVPGANLPDPPVPKRPRLKSSHCKYCPVESSRAALEEHLIQSDDCKSRYFEDLKVSKIETVLCLLFDCMFCDEGVNKLASHLKSNQECLDRYCRRFNTSSISGVTKKIISLRREGHNSRRPNARKAENDKINDGKKKSVTVVQAINAHKIETSWSNYRKCVMCGSNFTESTSREINSNNDEDKQFCLRSRPELKRFKKYFVCSDCETNGEAVEDECVSNLVDLRMHRRGLTLSYQPSWNQDDDDQTTDNLEVNAEENENPLENVENVTVLFPVSVLCVRDDFKTRKTSKLNVEKKILKCDTFSESLLSECYTTQYSKYETALNYSKRFTGTIENFQDKVIGNLTQIADDSRIRGSTKWRERKETNMNERIDQTGNSFFHLKITIEKLDEESKATALVISGKTVTCSYVGSDEMSLERQYFVHPDHNCESPCLDNCTIVPLDQYLLEAADDDLKSHKWASVFNSSCHQKLSSLIRNLLSCVNFQLYSEEMVFSLNFDKAGHAIIQGAFWTKFSETYNKELSVSSFTGIKDQTIRREFLQHVDSSLTCTANKEELTEKFNLSAEDAVKVSSLAERFQTCAVDDSNLYEMPSLETMFKEVPSPESMHNIYEARELVKLLRTNLASKDEEDISETSTSDWLQDLSNFHVVLDFNQERSVVDVTWDERVFSFDMEPRLSKLIVQYKDDPFFGIYHYSVTCVGYEYENSIVLQRLTLSDVYRRSYNPHLLLAIESEASVTPASGFKDWGRLNLRSSSSLPSADNEGDIGKHGFVIITFIKICQITGTGLLFHEELSIQEVTSLMKGKGVKDFSSRPVEFVNTNKDARISFKKVPVATGETFTAVGDNGHFEMQQNSVQRHKLRLNGASLTLAETSSWFSFVGLKESSELHSIYSGALDKIPLSEILSPITGEPYPTLIICSNGQVLRIRKKRKILSYPR